MTETADTTEQSGGGRALWLVLLVCLIFLFYAWLWTAETGDMHIHLLPWLDTILARGPIGAFAEPFSNYTPPYLYLLSLVSPLADLVPKISVIKLLAVAGTAALGLAGAYLLRTLGGTARWESALWLFLLPSVALNTAAFGQCDAMWAAACVMAVAMAVERRPVAMLIWFGIGFAFKAQAVFLAPFILQRLLAERTPLYWWPLPGLVYILAMLPAFVMGWPALDLATVYLRQAEWNPAFISNASNPWSLVQYLAPVAGTGWRWLGLMAAAAAALAFAALTFRRRFDPRHLLALALLAALLIPWLLPKMHERFFFLADILAFLLARLRRDRAAWLIFFLVESASCLAIVGLLAATPLPAIAGAVFNLAAMLLVVRSLGDEGKGGEPRWPDRSRGFRPGSYSGPTPPGSHFRA